jgi:hypothetical protein
MLEEIDPSTIKDEDTRALVLKLLNLLENAWQENKLLKEEVQHLRDENNRLKGQQGKPDLKPANQNYSSRAYTRPPKKTTEQAKAGKKAKLTITTTEQLRLDRQSLPPDAQFKGYERVVVQEVIFRPEVICFEKERYYSPAERMSYQAPLPPGFEGQFGPGLKALVLQLYYQAGLSESKILEVLTTFGFAISAAQISDWLIHDHQALFEAEKQALTKAGLESTPYQHFDHTGTRALGENRACHILCNPYYTVFTTLPKRDRLSVLRVLLGDREPTFCYNAEAASLLEGLGLAKKWCKKLAHLEEGRTYSQAELEKWLETHLPGLGSNGHKWVLAGLAIAAYHTQAEWPIVQTLVCDDAPVFNLLTAQLSLCWVHEARHYSRLIPRLAYHRKILEEFLGRFWRFYDRLLAYSQVPDQKQAECLRVQFGELFKAGGEYQALDSQTALSAAKADQLLLVLEQPHLPLHNNPAELAARQRVRKRDVSLAAATEAGLRAWDALQSVVATCRKLGVNVYHYLYDRLSGKRELASLAEMLAERAKQSSAFSYYPSELSRQHSLEARAKHGRGGRRVTSKAPPATAPPARTKNTKPAKNTSPAKGINLALPLGLPAKAGGVI